MVNKVETTKSTNPCSLCSHFPEVWVRAHGRTGEQEAGTSHAQLGAPAILGRFWWVLTLALGDGDLPRGCFCRSERHASFFPHLSHGYSAHSLFCQARGLVSVRANKMLL